MVCSPDGETDFLNIVSGVLDHIYLYSAKTTYFESRSI